MSIEANETLLSLEDIEEPFYERDVNTLIRKMKAEEDISKLSTEWLAEYIAFDFYEAGYENGSVWGTYFGPMSSGVNEDGTVWESPGIKKVTEEMLTYWASRARQSKHPILKARYSALVWDFSKEVTKNSADIEMAQIWIDSVIEIAQKDCHSYESDVVAKLKTILSLAISINDLSRVKNIKQAILDYEFNISGKHNRKTWGLSFDTLLLNKKINLSVEEQQQILDDLEEMLQQSSDFDNKKTFNPHVAEDMATRLAQYYRKYDKCEDVKRVLLKYGKAFEDISKEASGLLAIGWLQKVESIYRDFGLKNEADELLNLIRQRGPDAQKDMKTISVEQEISCEDMNSYVDAMLEGDIHAATARIAFDYIPKKDEVTEQIKDHAKNNPITFLFSATIQDYNGRTVAKIGSLEEDFESSVIMTSGVIENLVMYLSITFRRKTAEICIF